MTDSLARFARDELERGGSREAAWPRIGGFGHVARLRGLLELALTELEEAATALLDNVAQQEAREARGEETAQLFDLGGRLSVVVHLRVETVLALVRLLVDWLPRAIECYLGSGAVSPSLADRARRFADELRADRDLHVELAAKGRLATASIWALSGDAGVGPGAVPGSIVFSELVDRLDAYVDEAVAFCVTNGAD